MTASAARSDLVGYRPRPRPSAVERASVAWWLAFMCWFVDSTVGQFTHGAATVVLPYPYAHLQPGPAAVALFGLSAIFLASLVLPLRDGARWSRPLLTVLGCLLAFVLVWQFVRSVSTTPTVDSLTQAALSCVALGAVPIAVTLMYRADASPFFTPR